MTDERDEPEGTPADEAEQEIRRHRETVDEEVADLEHDSEKLEHDIEDVRREVRQARDSGVIPEGEIPREDPDGS